MKRIKSNAMKPDISDLSQLLRAEAEGILGIPLDNPFQEVAKRLNRTVKRGGKIIVTGVGKAGDVGRKIVSTFNSTGLTAVFLSPLDAVHGDFGVVNEKDAMILISNSGKTREVVELVKHTERHHARITTICITGNPRSPLARVSDYTLSTGNPKEICPLGMTPTSSVLAMLAIADVLTVLSMQARGFTAKEYHMRHHGGYLGSKAKELRKRSR